MRVLVVTQMWPSPEEPDLGSFLVPLTREIEAAGNEVRVVAISQRGGTRTKYARLVANAVKQALSWRPDVVFAHFLFPSGAGGLSASLAGRCPLVVMAHGQDVRNLTSIPGVKPATALVVRRASTVISNSSWLARDLERQLPAASPKRLIADCGIDLEAFKPMPSAEARAALAWDGDGPAFLCVGSLIERKNVVPLADAFARFRERTGSGRLAFVGDGPLRDRLEGQPGVRVVGRIPQSDVPRWIAACDVLCQPSLVEPFGQATLEGMAMERSVVATTEGGPPEFVTPEAGILVDPHDHQALERALEQAARLPSPNPAAREAAAKHDVKVEARKMLDALEYAARQHPRTGRR